MNMLDCQVLMQDVALELARLDRRLGEISVPSITLDEKSVEAGLPVQIHRPRRSLQKVTLLLLELVQSVGEERLRLS